MAPVHEISLAQLARSNPGICHVGRFSKGGHSIPNRQGPFPANRSAFSRARCRLQNEVVNKCGPKRSSWSDKISAFSGQLRGLKHRVMRDVLLQSARRFCKEAPNL